MEVEILITGIAGQGIQLAAKSLALAAAREGREVMLCPEYGGSMRGGSSLAQLAVGDQPVQALPVFHRASFALAVHDQFWPIAAVRLGPGALAMVNSTLAEGRIDGDVEVIDVPATQLATDVGNPNGAALTLAAAFVAATALVDIESLVMATADQTPPYRRQHIALNERAIRSGAAAAPVLGDIWAAALRRVTA